MSYILNQKFNTRCIALQTSLLLIAVQITQSNKYPNRATETTLKPQHGRTSTLRAGEAYGPQHVGSMAKPNCKSFSPTSLWITGNRLPKSTLAILSSWKG